MTDYCWNIDNLLIARVLLYNYFQHNQLIFAESSSSEKLEKKKNLKMQIGNKEKNKSKVILTW